ncbi:MAG: CBS domain-containing protein [Nitrospirae bacterium]|nr:MAG: CBS domain-containing protein [Nitrospirota bacterium]
MLKAKDIMSLNVITVSPAATVEALAKIFVENRISGAPVVDDSGNIYGIVTENDLISRNKRLHIPTVLRIFDAFVLLENPAKIEKEMQKMTAMTAGEICSKDVITVSEETSLEEIATIMAEKKIHLVPVVEGKKIRGIIGKIDLIKALAK